MVPLAPTPVDNGTEECDPVLPPGPEPAGSFEKSSFIEDRNRSSEVSAGPGDQLSSDESVHAALMKLQGQKGWFHNLRTSTGYPDALGVYSCTPDAEKWVYPAMSEAKGLLKRV